MLQKWDELNNLTSAAKQSLTEEWQRTGRLDPKKCEDLILDLLISAYIFGSDEVEKGLRIDATHMHDVIYKEIGGETFSDRIKKYTEGMKDGLRKEDEQSSSEEGGGEKSAVGEEGTGERQGTGEGQGVLLTPKPAEPTEPTKAPTTVVPGGGSGEYSPLPDIFRVADTESHRVYNDGSLEAAKKSGKKFKTWITMADDKVRETHDYLEGETIGIDEWFYTFDDDSARYPGDFESPANNANCRCALLFT